MNIFYYDIAIGLPLRQCFTYKSNVELKKGIRVLVPFGNKKLVGIVVKKNINSHLIEKSESIKDVISIIDNHTCFNLSLIHI